MSRISKLSPDQWDPELREMFAADSATQLELGTMRMFAHRPGIAKGIIALGAGIKGDWTLSARMMELVRLRVAYHNQCRSCLAIRYREAVEEGVSEDLVCSLQAPPEVSDLTDAEKVAIEYADRFATNHLSIDDDVLAQMRKHFSEPQLIELGSWIAFCVGFGRFGAVMDMVEELPEAYQQRGDEKITPWSGEPVIVR